MQHPNIAWCALLMVVLGPQAWAAPGAPADEAALRSAVTAYEQAIRSGDVSKSGIRKSLATGFSAVLPSGQLIANYGELSKAENALRTMVGRGARYDTTEVSVDPAVDVSGDLAVFTGRTLNHATAQGGKSLAFTTHWSAAAKKEDGAWRLLRHQAVMDPSTNPWNQVDAGGPGWSWVVVSGLLGGLAGAVIGFAAARARGRRSAAASGRAPSTPEQTGTAASSPARAWEKTTAQKPLLADADPAPAQGRSWHGATTPEVAASEPATAGDEAAAPEPEPPAPRTGKKRAWEN